MLLVVPTPYARFQLANKLEVCSKGIHPQLFNFRPDTTEHWVEDFVAVNGHGDNRIDAVQILYQILIDGLKNHSVSSVLIPKEVVIRNKSKLQQP